MRYFKHNKTLVSILLIFALLGFASGPLIESLTHIQTAQAVGGYVAVNALGQLDDNDQPIYTTAGADNTPNRRQLDAIFSSTALDASGHRLFVPDFARVLVFDLAPDNTLLDHEADAVLGQTDFKTADNAVTQTQINNAYDLAYDSTNDRLFVADGDANRVLVFDVADITNGEPAVNVIGQPVFTTGDPGTTQSDVTNPNAVAYDSTNNRLFVAENANNRVTVFDVDPAVLVPNCGISCDGPDAINVLGQDTFVTSSIFTSQDGMNSPIDLAYDPTNDYLFVVDQGNSRVTVFDVDPSVLIPNDPLTDGPDAINELGQPDDGDPFDSSDPGLDQSSMDDPQGVEYDSNNLRLFVGDTGNNRVLIFDLSGGITDGMLAANELGQPDDGTPFNSNNPATTQSGLDIPRGISYDATNDRIYVSDTENARIMIFDLGALADGMDATDLLGQVDQNDDPVFTAGGTTNPWGLHISSTQVKSSALDSVNHRLFVSDSDNSRVLVFNLDSNDQIVDYAADFVLCQTNFNTGVASAISQSSCADPGGLAYDAVTERLFVTDTSSHRILVFDLSGGITNGMDAANELGQNDDNANLDFFDDAAPTITQSGLNQPRDVSYDALNQRLFVTDGSRRVMVFDLSSGITNGMNASFELGQNDGNSNLDFFDDAVPATTQSGMDTPSGLAYDATDDRLFVADVVNHRVLIFDLSGGITNGMDAAFELGQTDDGTPFDGASSATTQSGMNGPLGISYDAATQRLFVADSGNNRVLIFDLSDGITNGMDASDVVGQTNFTSSTLGTAQNALSGAAGVDISGSRLFVMDTGNNRLMEFTVAAGATATSHTASDIVGQLDDAEQPLFTKDGQDNGPNQRGLDNAKTAVVDEVHHRLFVADINNARILVHDLDSSNHLTDRVPDFVLGQTDFSSNGSGVNQSDIPVPFGLAYSAVDNLLFASDFDENRVMVWDVSTITNGMNASYVIGQSDFTSSVSGTTDRLLNLPHGIALDDINHRLFVSDQDNLRALVFDVSLANLASEATGNGFSTNAINVLGAPNFTDGGVAVTQDDMGNVLAVVYDSTTDRLFAVDSLNRVMVFDTASITNGEPAINVIAQPDFTSNDRRGLAIDSLDIQGYSLGVALDEVRQQLFVGDTGNRRVMVFDVDESVLVPNCGLSCDGPNAINVLGQPDFTTNNDVTDATSTRIPAGLHYAADRLYVGGGIGEIGTIFRLSVFNVASIVDGEPATDEVGQLNPDDTVNFTANKPNNGPNRQGLSTPEYIALDEVNHRLFVTEYDNSRVLVFDLSATNTLIDHDADFVLGQPDFKSYASATSQAGMSTPVGVTYDSSTDRLFVSEGNGGTRSNRVTVFDVRPAGSASVDLCSNGTTTTGIANGMNASCVIGQPNFTTTGFNTTQTGLFNPAGLALDIGQQLLFVSEEGNNRVTVFDVASITNGEPAVNVIGQTVFTTNTVATTQSGMKQPDGIAVDESNERLFVGDAVNNRVLVFDLSGGISNGMSAANVLGQVNFTSDVAGTTQSNLSTPLAPFYEPNSDLLYVSDYNNNRVMVFDVTSITDGEDATDVYGQTTYTGNASGVSNTEFTNPYGLVYDDTYSTLWAVDSSSNRILIFTPLTPTPTPTPGGGGTPVDANPQGIIINSGDISTDSKNVLVTIRATFTDTFVGTVDVLLSNDPSFSTYIPFRYNVESGAISRGEWPKIVPWDLCFGLSASSCNLGTHRVYARFYFNVPKFSIVATPSP